MTISDITIEINSFRLASKGRRFLRYELEKEFKQYPNGLALLQKLINTNSIIRDKREYYFSPTNILQEKIANLMTQIKEYKNEKTKQCYARKRNSTNTELVFNEESYCINYLLKKGYKIYKP